MSRFPEKVRLDITNRLSTVHVNFINRIVERDFTPQEAMIQQGVTQLAKEFFDNRHQEHVTSFIFHNDSDDLQTHFMLRERDHSNNQVGLSFIKFVGPNRHRPLDDAMGYKELRARAIVMLRNTRYCGELWREALKRFVVNLGAELQTTHDFAISVIRERNALQISMREKEGMNMAHFYTRDLLNIEREQMRISRILHGTERQFNGVVHH